MTADETLESLVADARQIVRVQGANRQSLQGVLVLLAQAAEMPDRWSADRYPDPAPDESQARYLIRTESDESFTLYLNVMRPGKRIPPHNHTTWACIAAVSGTEHNTLYERTDGNTGAGKAQLRVIHEVAVRPGQGIALLPDDIHSVEIKGDEPIRHLHFYGRALETLDERLVFDLDRGEARHMKMSVATKR